MTCKLMIKTHYIIIKAEFKFLKRTPVNRAFELKINQIMHIVSIYRVIDTLL